MDALPEEDRGDTGAKEENVVPLNLSLSTTTTDPDPSGYRQSVSLPQLVRGWGFSVYTWSRMESPLHPLLHRSRPADTRNRKKKKRKNTKEKKKKKKRKNEKDTESVDVPPMFHTESGIRTFGSLTCVRPG